MGDVEQQFYVYRCSLAKHKHRSQISNQKITSNFKRSVQIVAEDHCRDTKLELVSQAKLTAHLGHNQAMTLI